MISKLVFIKSYILNLYNKLAFSQSIKIIIIILGIAFIWMLTGVFKSESATKKIEEIIPKVSVITPKHDERRIGFKINGVTKADRMVVLRPEIDGAVTNIIAKDGAFLQQGDPILIIDVENRKKALEAAKANLENNKILLRSAEVLYNKKLSSENAFLQAKTNFKTAESAYEAALSEYNKTTIYAPFDGYIDVIKVNEGDFISTILGSQIADFHSLHPIKASFDVPQNKRSLINDDSVVEIVSSAGLLKSGSVHFISNHADQSTRAYHVEAMIENKDAALKVGESISVNVRTDKLYRMDYIPKSAITLNEAGEIALKYVDSKNIVHTTNIKILDEDESGFWISGLIDDGKVISLGSAFVSEGDKVEIQ